MFCFPRASVRAIVTSRCASCEVQRDAMRMRHSSSKTLRQHDKHHHHHYRALRHLCASSSKRHSDPMAKRPNKLCDPYGQQGKPLSSAEIAGYASTIDSAWTVVDNDTAIAREFRHPDFLQAAQFAQKVAAVAQMNAHFPSITIDRRIVKRQWEAISIVRCHTMVLGGLSTHDFHLAMLVDVEVDRPAVKALLLLCD